MSIDRQQAAALAEGFLDNLGTDDKDTLQPRETFTELFLLAGEFIEDAQKNLEGNIATGNLSASLEAVNPRESGNTISVDVNMNFYGLFINKGVKGTRSGHSNAGYSFRTEFPGKKMVSAIEEWIKRAKSSTRTVKQYNPYGENETKNRKVAQYDKAYAVARSIKMLGIKPTGFLDKAESATAKKMQDRLGQAFQIDILNSI